VATGAAMMAKHTAVVLPLAVVGYAVLWWVVKPWREGESWVAWRAQLPGRLRASVQIAVLVAATIWV
jgi:1-acyl-sn-glycerol-3-phosphate acyltransferase